MSPRAENDIFYSSEQISFHSGVFKRVFQGVEEIALVIKGRRVDSNS